MAACRSSRKPVTANALNPGYVLTDLTRNVGGLLKIVVVLTSFMAQACLRKFRAQSDVLHLLLTHVDAPGDRPDLLALALGAAASRWKRKTYAGTSTARDRPAR